MTAIAIGKRRLCACETRCRIALEYRRYGEVEFTLCAGSAKSLAYSSLDSLIKHAEALPPLRNQKSWKQDEGKLKAYLAQGKTQGQIALLLGRPTTTVRKKIAHMRKTGKLAPIER